MKRGGRSVIRRWGQIERREVQRWTDSLVLIKRHSAPAVLQTHTTHTHTHTHKTKYRSRNSHIQSHGTVHKKYAQNTRTHAPVTKGTRQRKTQSHIPLCQERFASWLSESLESHNRPTEPATDRQSLTRALLELTRALIEESHSQTEPATDRQTDI